MNTQRINNEIDLAMRKLIDKEIVDLPKTLERSSLTERGLLLLEGDTLEEKAWSQLRKLKEIMLLDLPTFYKQHTIASKTFQYRVNRDQFDDHIADYLMCFTVPTTEDIDISIWSMKFYDLPETKKGE